MGNSSTAGEKTPPDAVQAAEIRAYLDRLTNSPAFASSSRRTRLLKYLVERALAGEGDRINEYAIGRDVFDKPASFDPRIESAVRTEVSRLRQKLKEYYASSGRDDIVVIDFPARGYGPAFSFPDSILETDRPALPPSSQPAPAATLSWRAPLMAVSVLVLIASGLVLWKWRSPAQQPIRSLVVLPFENLSPGNENEYLADGLTEEITNDLTQSTNLRVVARTSAFQFKGKGADVREIGRKLNVEAAMEGSLTKQGDRIRITAQLNRTSNGYRLWSKTYEARSADVMTVQQEIARSIAATADRLSGNAPEHVAAAPTSNPEALDLYLRGSYQLSRYTPDSLKRSIALFKEATEKDPAYARAYLGIATAERESIALTVQPPLEGAARVNAALRKSLELDPHSADAHGLLAKTANDYEWNWPRAEREFQLALEQGARSGVRSSYAWCLATRGRFSEAHTQSRIAETSDPVGMGPRSSQFWVYYLEHNFPEAKKTLRELLDIYPESIYVHALLGLIATLQKDCGESAVQFGWVARASSLPIGKCGLAYASACRGNREQSLRYLKEASLATKPMYASPYQLALGYAFLHDKETAITYLRQSAADREGQIFYLKYEPAFDELRSDPRYIAIEKDVGLVP